MYTMVTVVCSFIVLGMGWTLVFMFGLTTESLWNLSWLDEFATVVIGIAAGIFTLRFDKQHALPTAAVTGALIELAHAKISPGFASGTILRVLAMLLTAAAIALLTAWLWPRLAPRRAELAAPSSPDVGD